VLHPDPWARASAAEDLGVLHARHGDREQAIGQLKDALAGYQQVGADRDQARIRRRLRQLGIRRRHWSTPLTRPATGWHSLTDTEQDVAVLVAQGLNNNQVAARMYISTHTVAHHLRQAFRKLSIASRVELTRIVIEQAADDPGGLPTSTTWRYLRRPVNVIRCRNCSGVLMVISQIRRMNCVDLDGPAALHPGQDG
jgi:DNA-binding CsgD family transcriptional regulator